MSSEGGSCSLNDREKRALRAYTDVLAVEHDPDAGLVRVVTLSDSYLLVPDGGLHQCGDREYNNIELCKHVVACEVTRGNIDAPAGWLEVEDLDDGGCSECRALPEGFPCADCYINGDAEMEAGV